ncbi:class I glutamine amidotransferase-like protein [Phellopilus nigrolimitatus]|nr:class I glutamine amidotransferase-like protein [Phellopilus nigrolimitatus]
MSEQPTRAENAPLRVGMLLCGEVQLLDAAAVDLFAMLTPAYLRACKLPETIVAQGHDIEFRYITDSVKSADAALTHASLTGDVHIRLTDTLDSVGVLDYLLVPGPAPSYVPSAETLSFIRTHAKSARALLVICSGILPVAFAGVLTGKRATAPLIMLPMLRERGLINPNRAREHLDTLPVVPDVEWTEKRWEVDEEGKIWTSGMVTNGTDMVAAFLKKTFAPDLANLVCSLADVGDREQDYQSKPELF